MGHNRSAQISENRTDKRRFDSRIKVLSGAPAHKSAEKSGLANLHPDYNRASKQGKLCKRFMARRIRTPSSAAPSFVL